MTNIELSPRRYLVIQTKPETKPVAVITEQMRVVMGLKLKDVEFVEVTHLRQSLRGLVYDLPGKK